MKQLFVLVYVLMMLFSLAACGGVTESDQAPARNALTEDPSSMPGNVLIEKEETNQSEEETSLQISIQANDNTTIFELNNSQAAKTLYAQLPLTIDVEDYSNNEKIFYPPDKLDTTDTPLAEGELGTLAYYAPWGDVVMFYDSFASASGLFELGRAISGFDHIENMSGVIQIEKVEQG
ncbi:cyclophilin-like fold protein [Paenibacillus sp. sgz302251]|uniref:cyclophilin-like fold protein n=1 Tax=Paenibacillus sp. sgz302251 TaxID=3414493 RepID=UPI003C79EBC0